MSRRSVRIAVMAFLVMTAMVLPGHGRTDQPPASRMSEHLVSRWSQVGPGGWRTSAVIDVPDLVLAGGTWEGPAEVQVRARTTGGWDDWRDLERQSDHGDADHGRSEPVWTGQATALQLRTSGSPDVEVTTVTMSGPDGLAYSPLDTSASAAFASSPDRIVARSEWDPAGECRPKAPPQYAPEVEVGVVHHTHIFPHYGRDEADDLIRAVCLYHVGERGFDDLAYNLLIDRYGVVYEGRAGGVEKGVVGAHAAGFNEASFGVAVLGDFEEHDVPQPAVDALDRVLAWKFSVHDIDPRATHEVTSTGGDTPGLTQYPAGTQVTMPSIIGHRDTSSDSLCPGRHLYARLDGAPDRVASLLKAGARMRVVPAEPSSPERPGRGGLLAGRPTGPGSGSVGLMAAPAQVPNLPHTGGTPAPLLGGAALGVTGLALGGRRRRERGS